MKKYFSKTVIIFTVIATLTTGCRSSEEYKKLTDAGTKYAEAVNELLTTAGDIRIDLTSEQILRDDRQSNQSLENYTQRSQSDLKRLQVIEEVRNHNTLLKKYFSTLQELATSDAPASAQSEIASITQNLNKSSQILQNSDLFSSRNQGIAQAVTHAVISSKIKGALKEELEKRHQTILKELTIQQEMLNYLSESLQHDVEMIQSAREQRLIIEPLTSSTKIQEQSQWIEDRRKILTMDRKVEELKNAGEALGEFKTAYQAAVSGELNVARLNHLLKDIDTFLALVENKN
ncbi:MULTISPECIES: hypothetical protein [Nostocales]|uniref:Lipoprotein n=3 Tax=Nostocales TaxID=1161 RepID=A0A0C1RDD5_9CYAN|nr:hypothetical protein [Tolypothrix bouteillei]KAF3884301.1 hypothetical protein DA73_0400001465 [Tolypothrix bouteillei VB521301]